MTDGTGAFDERDLEFAELLVSYATATRERIRSEAALREARRITEQLHDAAAEVAAADDEGELLDRAVRAASDVLSFDKSTITLRRGTNSSRRRTRPTVPPTAPARWTSTRGWPAGRTPAASRRSSTT
ncbi:hypothetical protein ACFQRB_04125 [Halobaculum litoreum]|uniref:Uncharacterized protein n=1 Tax=Halobaculum litoreum TaxID=3031998 RepID=A0ABD5XR09_9EURY